MKGRRWIKSEIETLIKLYPDHTNEEIADRLGRAKGSVCTKASELRLKKRAEHISRARTHAYHKTKNADVEAVYRERKLADDIICHYHRRGCSIEKTAEEINVAPEAVKQILDDCMKDGRYEKFEKRDKALRLPAYYSNSEATVKAARRNSTAYTLKSIMGRISLK